MANKLTRIEIDSGMKEFIPKTGFTGDDLKQIGKKSFLIEFMNDERFDDIMLLSMIFIFENL